MKYELLLNGIYLFPIFKYSYFNNRSKVYDILNYAEYIFAIYKLPYFFSIISLFYLRVIKIFKER